MIIQRAPIGRGHAAQVKDDLIVNNARKAIGGKMVRALLWDDNEVRVSDAVAVNEITDAFQGEGRAHSAADALRDGHYVRRQWVGHVGEVVNMCGMTRHSPGAVSRSVMNADTISSR